MKQKKSAKDIAFDRERAKYRHEIRDLTKEIKTQKEEISVLNQKIQELKESVRQKDEWINRLLEYTELSEEDMKKKIQKDKDIADIISDIEQMEKLIFGMGKCFGL